ncbi:MAG: hypothetical protein ACKV22_19345 [Bryobacteraceae bacterium]
MTDRRGFLERLAALPLVGPLVAGTRVGAPASRDFLRELNVQPIINAAGSYTMFTGSLLRPEVVRAYESMSKRFVRLDELHDAVGKRIASLLGVEAAMVPSGAAGGLLAGTAACITGKDPEKIAKIPHIPGMKNEAVVQKSHRFPYDHLVRACGVHLIEVETSEELERAISSKTAHLLFLNKAEPQGRIKAEEFVALGKKHGIPTFNDAAADVPPVENLTRPIKLGFDLVAISGGKGIRGPQSAGLLLGRKDLIEAARLNSPPNSDTIGRASKVNKEEDGRDDGRDRDLPQGGSQGAQSGLGAEHPDRREASRHGARGDGRALYAGDRQSDTASPPDVGFVESTSHGQRGDAKAPRRRSVD